MNIKTHKKKKLSFRKGMESLIIKDQESFYKEIEQILGLSSKQFINFRLKRGGAFSPVEYNTIINLFKKYGVEDSYEEIHSKIHPEKTKYYARKTK